MTRGAPRAAAPGAATRGTPPADAPDAVTRDEPPAAPGAVTRGAPAVAAGAMTRGAPRPDAAGAAPGKAAERGQRQRDRILAAAQQCFITHGFHAASMANIAETAGMSAGLIYRYFAGKADIILAIIARQLQDSRDSIAALQHEADFERRILALFEGWRAQDPAVPNVALFLEMTAQASRDPRIAAAIEDADRISGDDFTAWLRRRAQAAGATPPEPELRARALALKAFIDGLAVRALRAPHTDPAVVAQALRDFLPRVLEFG